jgi:hypothetical protein
MFCLKIFFFFTKPAGLMRNRLRYRTKGAFTFANFERDFALSQHVLLQKKFITKRASLVRNRPQNRANVNAP